MEYVRKPSKLHKDKTTKLENGVLIGEQGQTLAVGDIELIHLRDGFGGRLVVEIRGKGTKIILLSSNIRDGEIVDLRYEVLHFADSVRKSATHEIRIIQGSNSNFIAGLLMGLLGLGLTAGVLYRSSTGADIPLGKTIGALVIVFGIAFGTLSKGRAKEVKAESLLELHLKLKSTTESTCLECDTHLDPGVDICPQCGWTYMPNNHNVCQQNNSGSPD